MSRGIHVELRGQRSAVGSLLPPWDILGPNSGDQAYTASAFPF